MGKFRARCGFLTQRRKGAKVVLLFPPPTVIPAKAGIHPLPYYLRRQLPNRRMALSYTITLSAKLS